MPANPGRTFEALDALEQQKNRAISELRKYRTPWWSWFGSNHDCDLNELRSAIDHASKVQEEEARLGFGAHKQLVRLKANAELVLAKVAHD